MIKQIKFHPDYFVHADGYVISMKRVKEHRMKGGSSTRGYAQVTLITNGIQSQHLVHRLVAETFLDKLVGKTEVNHIDGDKKNNHVSNLEWVTGSENMKHAVANGLWKAPTKEQYSLIRKRAGESVARFTVDEASDILEMKDSLGLSSTKLATIVGCSKSTIARLVNGTTKNFKQTGL